MGTDLAFRRNEHALVLHRIVQELSSNQIQA